MENINNKKSLLQRYGIPINHLDFKYIQDCQDSRELEKIVHILRSNEEGYFPQLTQCAEDKLRELKPQSRLFRVEEPIKGREALEPKDIKPIYDWNKTIKTTDKQLKKLVNEEDPLIPPIRRAGRILTKAEKETNSINNTKSETKKSERIKSTDYNKWDKYDPEEEILRLELAEERQQEAVEYKNRLNAEKFTKEPLKITEILEENQLEKHSNKWCNLTDIEKEKLSEEYRLRGNEYFRSKEFDNALYEYTRAIQIFPEKAVAAYNNRALTYFKQQKFLDSIKDCEECLKLEPNNLKARLRLAEASYAYGRRRESYQLYNKVLQLDPENSVALKATTELRKQFEDLPPLNATRLQIQDESNKTKQVEKYPKEQPKSTGKTNNYDLAELVKPNRVVKNKLLKATENLSKIPIKPQEQNKVLTNTKTNELRLPGTLEINSSVKGKKLIEEL